MLKFILLGEGGGGEEGESWCVKHDMLGGLERAPRKSLKSRCPQIDFAGFWQLADYYNTWILNALEGILSESVVALPM